MLHFGVSELTHLLATYGYVAVLLFVAIESTGIPFLDETMLLVAAIAAGTTHQLSIALVIVAATSGAILGDNLGFWVGREGGYRLLRRYGRSIRLEERRLKLGQYLFMKHRAKSSSSGALWRGCLPGPRFWPGPTACTGRAFCSSMRWEATC